MKINGSSGPRPAAARPKRATPEAAGVRFTLPAEAPQSRSVAAGGPTGAIDSLLALQEVPDLAADTQRARRRGHDLLDQLDRLRHALLDGRLDRAQLDRMASLVRARREAAADPALAAVLAEIEVRAAVELAKLERA